MQRGVPPKPRDSLRGVGTTLPLLINLSAALAAAFVCGLIATSLRLSPIVGYLVAGIAVGPFTPGFVADQPLAAELSEIGVILLMFGVGLHFSLGDLLAVRKIAIPGAAVQIATVPPAMAEGQSTVFFPHRE